MQTYGVYLTVAVDLGVSIPSEDLMGVVFLES